MVAEGQSPKAVSLEVLPRVFPGTMQLLVGLLSPASVQPEHSAWQLSISASSTASSEAGWRTSPSKENASNEQAHRLPHPHLLQWRCFYNRRGWQAASRDGCSYFPDDSNSRETPAPVLMEVSADRGRGRKPFQPFPETPNV